MSKECLYEARIVADFAERAQDPLTQSVRTEVTVNLLS